MGSWSRLNLIKYILLKKRVYSFPVGCCVIYQMVMRRLVQNCKIPSLGHTQALCKSANDNFPASIEWQLFSLRTGIFQLYSKTLWSPIWVSHSPTIRQNPDLKETPELPRTCAYSAIRKDKSGSNSPLPPPQAKIKFPAFSGGGGGCWNFESSAGIMWW